MGDYEVRKVLRKSPCHVCQNEATITLITQTNMGGWNQIVLCIKHAESLKQDLKELIDKQVEKSMGEIIG